MKDSFGQLPENTKQVIKSVAPLLIVIILFLFVGKFGVGKITGLSTKIKDSKRTQTILQEKLNILTSVSQTAAVNAGRVVYALPESNPTIAALSQLKNLALTNNLILKEIRSSNSSSDTSFSSVNISFSVEGARDSILAFINSIKTVAPIMLVSRAQLREGQDIAKADITVSSFWAGLPSSIPPVTQTVSDLTASEKEMLIELSQLNQLVYTSTNSATSSDINLAPFGQ